jgi:hypothetical protein
MRTLPQENTQQMKKHKFNIFPAAKAEDYNRLRDDIRDNGYDSKQPIIIYEGQVLDGWNRWTACIELKINPPTRQFDGDESEAIGLVMRTNKRRNLNSGQWATIAVEADDIIKAIAQDGKARQIRKPLDSVTQKIAPQTKDQRSTSHKAAEIFNTNRTYVSQAAKIKHAAPEVFEKVKAGKMTMQDAARAVRAIPTEPWLDDEKERKQKVESGKTVVANSSRDKNLIQWAEKRGLAIRVDRSSEFGNPFILEDDGTRDEVCDAYATHYLPNKPSIQSKIKTLQGKVLICHCYPQRCHGDALAKKCNH